MNLMFEFKIKIPCKRPKIVAESLKPDIKNDKYSKIKISPGKNFVELHVSSSRVGHMKAIVNTYISLIGTLEKIEKEVK